MRGAIEQEQVPTPDAAWIYLAMALHDTKQPAEARKWLTRVTQYLDRRPPEQWYDRVHLRALRREVEALVLGKKP